MRIRPSRASDRRLEGRLGWLELQEARCNRFRRSTSNGRRAGDCPKGSRPTVKLSLGERDAKACSGTQIAARGCRKATPRDREVPVDPQGSSWRSHGLLGPQGPAVADKAPAYPSHPRRRLPAGLMVLGESPPILRCVTRKSPQCQDVMVRAKTHEAPTENQPVAQLPDPASIANEPASACWSREPPADRFARTLERFPNVQKILARCLRQLRGSPVPCCAAGVRPDGDGSL
jgi:hypothetical protein